MYKLQDIPEIFITDLGVPAIDDFKRMDNLAIDRFNLPVELMMENAGLQLARLAALLMPDKRSTIKVGIGTGNNGGGGLVAARRLSGWGYKVYLDIPVEQLKQLTATQLKRALAFGVTTEPIENPDLFIDAYLGFSQKIPLSPAYQEAIKKANAHDCLKISLDLPTGFNKKTGASEFVPDIILTLASPKKELLKPGVTADVYVADIGIPFEIYKEFGIHQPDFSNTGIIRLKYQTG